MENVNRGPTFGVFVTSCTEASMYCVRVSLWTVKIFLAQHLREGSRETNISRPGLEPGSTTMTLHCTKELAVKRYCARTSGLAMISPLGY
jgi:hypothetical protein